MEGALAAAAVAAVEARTVARIGARPSAAAVANDELRKMMPGPEILEGLVDLASIATRARLDIAVWKRLMAALGDEALDDFPSVVALTNADYRQGMADAGLNVVQKTRVSVVVNMVRVKHGLPVNSLANDPEALVLAVEAPPAAETKDPEGLAATISTILAAIKEKEDPVSNTGIKVSQVWDQGSRLVVQPVAEDTILAMRQRWIDKNGLPPPDNKDLSDTQLSVLARLMELDKNMLGFDMGILGAVWCSPGAEVPAGRVPQ